MNGFLIILVVPVLIWLFVVMPIRRRQRSRVEAHESMQDALTLGDEIITAGGLHGIVRSLAENELRIEIAPGVVATLDRRAVAAVAREVEVEVDAHGDSGVKESGSEADLEPR